MKMTFGEKLREERKKRGLSAEELGAKIGVGQSSISKFETGERNPSFKTTMKIAKALGIDVGYLMNDDAKPIEHNINGDKYSGYYVALDTAIDNRITPEDLEEAVKFIARQRR